MRLLRCAWLASALALVSFLGSAEGGEQEVGPIAKDVQTSFDKAVAFLKTRQTKEGAFSPKFAGPGVSALVVTGLIQNGVSAKEPLVAKTLDFLEKQVQPDGGVYNKFLANYTTSIAVVSFKEANTGGKYDAIIKNAAAFIRGLQQDGMPKDVKHGGFGYDAKSRPDLSNANFSVEALLAAGVSKDDPAVKKALLFISRCQNLPGETNDQRFATKTTADDKGGFTYNPIDPEESRYKTSEGGLRSLGGMTYGGLKSFLYAGVDKKDPRVQAAINWIRRHYTLEENPNMGQAGLYYYYHTFAKAMDAWGEDVFVDAAGKKHDWRRELFEALKKRQQTNGSWVNAGDKMFGESNPELATAFAVLSLSYCRMSKR